MPQIQEHAKNILRLRKGEELLLWILQKIMKKDLSRQIYISETSSLALCLHNFVFRYFQFIILFIYCQPG